MKCFYHNDLDGRCAGSIVAQYENDYNVNNYHEVDYIMDLSPMLNDIVENEKVYFVDYSFTEKTLWVLDSLINKNCDIIWIDHHNSSLELIKAHKELVLINGIRLDGISGAGLTYMYLHNCGFDDIPYHVQLVSDYDCWKFKFEPHTTYFKLGIESEDYDALDLVWKELNTKSSLKKQVNSMLEKIISNGTAIKRYVDKDNEQYRKQFAYESEICGYKALVVNRKTNSWIFGEEINNYPLVCVWVFNGSRYSYSIFSKYNDVDCSKIAESFGGGGHKGAAGFGFGELLFKEV